MPARKDKPVETCKFRGVPPARIAGWTFVWPCLERVVVRVATPEWSGRPVPIAAKECTSERRSYAVNRNGKELVAQHFVKERFEGHSYATKRNGKELVAQHFVRDLPAMTSSAMHLLSAGFAGRLPFEGQPTAQQPTMPPGN